MTDKIIGQTITISQSELAGLKIMLNIGAQLVNKKLFETCRQAAESAKLDKDGHAIAYVPKEFSDWREGQRIAKSFLDKISN